MSANDRLLLGSNSGRGVSPLFILSLLSAFLVHSTCARADVTVYESVPSVEELQQKLLGGSKADQKKYKTRAIVFGDTPADNAQAQDSPASQVASASPQTATNQAQPVQVSENAIAFPIQFRVNSAQVLPESAPYLQSIAGLMQKDQAIRLLIEGHTDISGSYQHNVALSRERAFAVMNYLIDRFGLEPIRFMPVGKGPTDPLQGLDPTDSRNRRVQFRIIG